MDARNRAAVIARTSALGIVVNLLLAAVKVVAGVLASSIAIVSEGVNNAADALTSVLTFVGAKLAGRHPDAKHPFGYGRIEYLTGLVVGYELRDWEGLRAEFLSHMEKTFPANEVVLTIETEFV